MEALRPPPVRGVAPGPQYPTCPGSPLGTANRGFRGGGGDWARLSQAAM